MSEILSKCRFCESVQLDLIKQHEDMIGNGVNVFLQALETKQDMKELLGQQIFGFIFCVDCGRINQKLTQKDVDEFRNAVNKEDKND